MLLFVGSHTITATQITVTTKQRKANADPTLGEQLKYCFNSSVDMFMATFSIVPVKVSNLPPPANVLYTPVDVFR
jgi:hypothetical protein